jgi:hypothetical protein
LKRRRTTRSLTLKTELDAALAVGTQGNSAIATTWLTRLDQRLVYPPSAQARAAICLMTRASSLAVSEVLVQHSV